MNALDLHELARQLAPLIAEQTRPAGLLDADQAAELLSVPKSWLMAEARARRVPHARLGKYVRFNGDELRAWVSGRSVGPRATR